MQHLGETNTHCPIPQALSKAYQQLQLDAESKKLTTTISINKGALLKSYFMGLGLR